MHSHPILANQPEPKRKHHVLYTDESIGKEAPIEIEHEKEVEPTTINVEEDSVIEDIPGLEDITAVVVNFQTEHLIKQAVETFRAYYPTVQLVIVDNHSTDGSREWIREQADENTRIVLNWFNNGHGPALDREFNRAKTKFVFSFDSDVIFLRGGVLEEMQERIEDAYAIGWLRWVNLDGVAVDEKRAFNKDSYCPYIHPYCALYHRDTYLSLTPFVNKGAPAVDNMRDAKKRGLELVSFKPTSYVKHLIAGTRRMWQGHWFPGEKKPMSQWEKDSSYPI